MKYVNRSDFIIALVLGALLGAFPWALAYLLEHIIR